MRCLPRGLALAAVLLATACDGGAACPSLDRAPKLSIEAPSAYAGSTITVHLSRGPRCRVESGTVSVELSGMTVSGGGRLEPAEVTLDKAGRATAKWHLGPAPILQRISGEGLEVTVSARVAAPVAPKPHLDIDQWMNEQGLEGSTEDLAIRADGSMVLGIPGGLLHVDPAGAITRTALSGDPIERALGVALDGEGNIWVADSKGRALRRVAPDGRVTTPLESDGKTDFAAPNYVAIQPGTGRVFVSDSCLDELVAWDPAGGKVAGVHAFSGKTEGGPNGFAFSADGGKLWITTENTALLCPSGDKPDVQARVGALFSVDVSGGALGPRRLVQAGIGHFGDGMALDAEGNLYVVVTSGTPDLRLESSQVMVLRKGEDKLVPFIRTTDRIMANVAFGRGPLGATTMYIGMLAIPPFSLPETRGLTRIEVGVEGQPLL